MLTRSAVALAAVLGFAFAARAADLPVGTWPANLDGTKGDLVITQAKDGKVAGSLLGTDFTGTWDGKALAFTSGGLLYEAHLLAETGVEKGKTKYTLTGTQARPVNIPNRAGNVIHYAKVGWYAQITTDSPAPTGFIRAEVRGTLVYSKTGAHVLVKHLVGAAPTETRVQLAPDDWNAVKGQLAALNDKDVIVSGALVENPRDRANPFGGLSLVGKLEIKPATDPK